MKIKKTSRNGRTRKVYVKNNKFNRFLELHGLGFTPEQIMKKLEMSKSHYFQCMEMIEEFKENYLMALAESGLVLRHRFHLENITNRLNYLNHVLDEQHKKIDKGQPIDKWFYLRTVNQANETERLAVDMLGNAYIVKGIEQLFVKLSMKRKESD